MASAALSHIAFGVQHVLDYPSSKWRGTVGWIKGPMTPILPYFTPLAIF